MRFLFAIIFGLCALPVAAPASADEDVDLLIAYILHELEARQTRCGEEVVSEFAGKRVVCAQSNLDFSALRSDWSQLMRHSKLPIRIRTEEPWTFRDPVWVSTYAHGSDRTLHVAFEPEERGMLFSYVEQDVDPYADTAIAKTGPLDLPGSEQPPRMAGFGGVSLPKLIEESHVEPIRSILAQAERVVGNVSLEIVVNKDGSVRRAVALRESPEGYSFADAAVAAVTQWRFEPATLEGEPVDVVINRSVEVKQDPPPGEEAADESAGEADDETGESEPGSGQD